jgi:uncharacterized protein YdhG (YjbR/CyaY superfamily)
MDVFAEYLARMAHPSHRACMEEVLSWVGRQFPNLSPRMAWNQPMFTDHGTYIVGFSASKHHLAVAPERATIVRFSDEIARAGYDYSRELVRIPWDSPVDYSLLEKMIAFNISDKADSTIFWRKEKTE